MAAFAENAIREAAKYAENLSGEDADSAHRSIGMHATMMERYGPQREPDPSSLDELLNILRRAGVGGSVITLGKDDVLGDVISTGPAAQNFSDPEPQTGQYL